MNNLSIVCAYSLLQSIDNSTSKKQKCIDHCAPERSEIPGVWIVITVLALFVVIGSVTFENFKNVYAAEDLNVKVNVGEDDIERGETQKITVTVTEDGNSNDEISGADVKLTVYPPETDSTTAKDETDEDGKANFDVKISDEAEYGTYKFRSESFQRWFQYEI